jgi:hypothetical protein
MKLYQRLFIAAAALTLGVLGGVTRTEAQSFGVQPLWANYAVQYVNEFYNPLAGGTLIPADSFVNFSGAIDHDDGTETNIPTGFIFDYNGNSYNSVNVNINGWVSIGPRAISVTPNNNANLFTVTEPNNTVAPYWGDHYYRTSELGYTPSAISYLTTRVADPNPNAPAGSVLHTFTIEWKNLNINDKTNPNSIASFQLRIIENPLANDLATPDNRALIEFQYGPIGTTGTVSTVGAAVGAEDSVGFTHINALFATAAFNGDSTRLNVTARSTCWPPATCLPGRAIQLVPQGRASLNQWGDGDVNLDQVNNPDPVVRANQSRFVTLQDADLILSSRANNQPLDSVEGHAAFHGDANHDGRVYNSTYGAYFYYVTSYDAAYIMLYLAGKLAVLPWPLPLPVPGYKSADIHTTDVSGVVADAQNIHVTGNTVLVPITVRGRVNGALSLEMNIASMNASNIQFVGTQAIDGAIVHSNASTGKVVLATSGSFEDGATIGYLEFNIANKNSAEFDIANVQVNDQDLPGSHVALKLSNVNSGAGLMNSVDQNMPNPFIVSSAGHTTIGFDLANSENVSLRMFDMLGHEVRTLIGNETRAAGHNSIEWDGRDVDGNIVASGLYYYQVITPDFTQTVKMQVVR